MTADAHTPTNAGPGVEDSSFGTDAGAAGVAAEAGDRPELLAGAAFAGGLLAALILRRFRVRD